MDLPLFTLPPEELASWLHWPEDFRDTIRDKLYYSFYLDKKNGGKRQIHAPEKHLKWLQKTVSHILIPIYMQVVPEAVHGYIPGEYLPAGSRSILTHASAHFQAGYVLSLDIESFFPSITRSRISSALKELIPGIHPDTMEVILELTTYDNSLPMGSPASPVLSNIVMLPLDKALEELAIKEHLKYTRYVDDMSFSTNTEITQELLSKIISVIIQYGFPVNESKTHLYNPGEPRYITGLILEEDRIRVSADLIENIRDCIEEYKKVKWLASHLGNEDKLLQYKAQHMKQSIQGQLAFMAMVTGTQDEVYLKLQEKAEKASHFKKPVFDFYI